MGDTPELCSYCTQQVLDDWGGRQSQVPLKLALATCVGKYRVALVGEGKQRVRDSQWGCCFEGQEKRGESGTHGGAAGLKEQGRGEERKARVLVFLFFYFIIFKIF